MALAAVQPPNTPQPPEGVDAPRALALAAAGAAAGDAQARVLTHYGALRLADDVHGLTRAAPGDEVLGAAELAAAALVLLLAPGTHVATLAEAGNLLAAAVARLDAVLDPSPPPGVPGPAPAPLITSGGPPGGWPVSDPLALLSHS